MYLDAVKTINTKTNGDGSPVIETTNFTRPTSAPVFDKWKDWHASEISHHGAMCCEIAREWLTATDYSELASGGGITTGPRWLRQKFNWGASAFPIFWCEAVRKKTLDCGALAALAFEVFKARGVKSYRVQMVQRFSDVATKQWESSWNPGSEPLRWTQEDLIYHEGCAIDPNRDGEIKIWDSSAGWWVDPASKDGYGALLAVRLSGFNLPQDARFAWGAHTINAEQWTAVN